MVSVHERGHGAKNIRYRGFLTENATISLRACDKKKKNWRAKGESREKKQGPEK